MKNDNSLAMAFLNELETEVPSTRKCLERIPAELFDWKPHERSMPLGYLSLVIAEIPLWITVTVEKGEIDYGTFQHFRPKTTAELVGHFDENIEGVRRSLRATNDEVLNGPFQLKFNGQVLLSIPKKDSIGPTINHLVHHRGQLTVYMRLNNIPVPSIYGPSADERGP